MLCLPDVAMKNIKTHNIIIVIIISGKIQIAQRIN